MKRLLLVAAFFASLGLSQVYVNPVCTDMLKAIGVPVVPGHKDFVQVFIHDVPAGRSLFVVLRYDANGESRIEAKIVTAGAHGALALFDVPHGATGFATTVY